MYIQVDYTKANKAYIYNNIIKAHPCVVSTDKLHLLALVIGLSNRCHGVSARGSGEETALSFRDKSSSQIGAQGSASLETV